MKKLMKCGRYVGVLVVLFLLSMAVEAQHTFEIKGGQFVYDGKPVQIRSGEMHYARIPKPYWRHRLQMLKAMGLNTVATYVFWNYHHPAPGVWDFSAGNKDVAEFIRIAQQEGMFVILRPGPYACAEWEFGGYPWWLQKDPAMVIRTYNQPFLDSCKTYINKLADKVRSLQVTKGGPIIMVQAENEFGSYVSQRKDIPLEQHKQYNQAIYAQLKASGFDVPFFTSDGAWLFSGGAIDGVLPTANGEGNVANLKKAVDQYHHGEGPYMVAEYYPGWLHHWGEPFPHISKEDVTAQLEKYVTNGVSFNIYMAHGGTNFGFTSGANYDDAHDIQPDLTTYDYDAPVSEPGWATPKYMAIRELLQKHSSKPLPAVPARIPVVKLTDIALTKAVDFFEWKKSIKPVVNDTPLTFEALDQGHGFVLYSRSFTQPIEGKLQVPGLRDYALVYINGKKVGELNRQEKKYEIDVAIPFNGRLELLVENMGRINYGANIVHNQKGIIAPVTINDFEITGGWNMYKVPLDQAPVVAAASKITIGMPVMYSGTFQVKEPGDVFLDMRGWGKGVVFVNGQSLGRFWKIGPQQTLYLPGCWLKKGINEVVVFEMQHDQDQQVLKSTDTPILGELH
jgi:beta-galactosidase